MGEDGPSGGRAGIQSWQYGGDVLVREPMKTVSPQTILRVSTRQAKPLGDFRLSAVECSIETRHLGNEWHGLHCSFDRSEVVRLLQGGQRHKPFDFTEAFPRD